MKRTSLLTLKGKDIQLHFRPTNQICDLFSDSDIEEKACAICVVEQSIDIDFFHKISNVTGKAL